MKGVVHQTGGGAYDVHLEDGRSVEASLRGRLKRETRTGDRVVIGDRVRVESSGDAWTIEDVEPRRTELVRRGRGGREAKVLAANLSHVFAVVSALEPDLTEALVDRLLVVGEASGLRPILVLNKMDLPGARDVAGRVAPLYERVGYRVLPVSAETKEGLEPLLEEICDGASALMGPSGAGKSSILNAIDPSLGLRTGELSRKTGTGRHTTVSARLIPLSCGGLVADTPGFGDVGLWAVEPEDVARCFPEFGSYVGECRFRGCAHLQEPDCGVKGAVESGAIAASRYDSYVTLREEAEEAAGP